MLHCYVEKGLSKLDKLGNRSGAKAEMASSSARDEALAGVQELSVYEINERDRGSPVVLPFGGKKNDAGVHVSSLGDLVPFSNKVGWFNSSFQIFGTFHYYAQSD